MVWDVVQEILKFVTRSTYDDWPEAAQRAAKIVAIVLLSALILLAVVALARQVGIWVDS